MDVPEMTSDQKARLAYAVGLVRAGNWYWTMYLVSSMMAADAMLLGSLKDEIVRLRGRRRIQPEQIAGLMEASRAIGHRSEMIRDIMEQITSRTL